MRAYEIWMLVNHAHEQPGPRVAVRLSSSHAHGPRYAPFAFSKRLPVSVAAPKLCKRSVTCCTTCITATARTPCCSIYHAYLRIDNWYRLSILRRSRSGHGAYDRKPAQSSRCGHPLSLHLTLRPVSTRYMSEKPMPPADLVTRFHV